MSRSSFRAEEEVAMYGEKDLDSTEERLRKRIRKAITGGQRPLPAAAMRPIEDRFLAMMKDYFGSEPEERDKLYDDHEAQLLEAVRRARRTSKLKHWSSGGEG